MSGQPIKATITVAIKPWSVPNFVARAVEDDTGLEGRLGSDANAQSHLSQRAEKRARHRLSDQCPSCQGYGVGGFGPCTDCNGVGFLPDTAPGAEPSYAAAAEQMIAHEDSGGDGWWLGFEMLKAAHAKAKGAA